MNSHPSTQVTELPGRKLDWNKLELHLQEIGTFHASIYRLLRDISPAIVLIWFWLSKHPGVIFHTPFWYSVPRISLLEFIMLVFVTILMHAVAGRGSPNHKELIHSEISSNLVAAFLCTIAITPCLLAKLDWERTLELDLFFFAGTSIFCLVFLAAACLVGWASIDTIIPKRDVLIIGTGRSGQGIFEEIVDSPVYRVVGLLDDNFFGTTAMEDHYLGGLSLLEKLLKENPISVVYSSLPVKSMYDSMQNVIQVCERFGVEVRHSSQFFQTSIGKLDHHAVKSYSILSMVRRDSTRYVKRGIDLLFASALLTLAIPLMLVSGIAIKLTSPGPIFFSQDRYGLHRRRFRIYKMRTMVINAEILHAGLEAQNELGGPVFKIRRDPRVTRVGSFLRKTSIDELPQLWNVLRGEMSLVGPRPLAVRDVMRIEDSAQLRRFSVLPGITCIWQISGRNNTDFDAWIRQDLEYIDSWSLLLDLKIMLGTIPAVIWGKGAM